MLPHPAIFGINHLLQAEPWARERLQPFAGKRVVFRAPPLPDLKLAVTEAGLVTGSDAAEECDLSISIGPGALPHLFARDEALLQHVEISGNAELASAVQFLFRNLKWDVAEDLSKVVGDVAAQRMVGAGRDFLDWQKDAMLRAGQNLAEYWTEEQPLLARAEEIERFNRAVDALRDDLARLAKRIEKLGSP